MKWLQFGCSLQGQSLQKRSTYDEDPLVIELIKVNSEVPAWVLEHSPSEFVNLVQRVAQHHDQATVGRVAWATVFRSHLINGETATLLAGICLANKSFHDHVEGLLKRSNGRADVPRHDVFYTMATRTDDAVLAQKINNLSDGVLRSINASSLVESGQLMAGAAAAHQVMFNTGSYEGAGLKKTKIWSWERLVESATREYRKQKVGEAELMDMWDTLTAAGWDVRKTDSSKSSAMHFVCSMAMVWPAVPVEHMAKQVWLKKPILVTMRNKAGISVADNNMAPRARALCALIQSWSMSSTLEHVVGQHVRDKKRAKKRTDGQEVINIPEAPTKRRM